MIRVFVVIAVIFFSFQVIHGQDFELDEQIHQKALSFYRGDKDSLLFYSRRLQESKNHCRMLFGKCLEANKLYNDGLYEDTEEVLEDILLNIEENDLPLTFEYSDKLIGKTYDECISIIKMNVYRRYFYIRLNQDEFEKAYEYLLLRKEIVENLPRRYLFSSSYDCCKKKYG